MAFPAVGTTEWNEVATAHFQSLLKSEPRDQYFKKHPLLLWMKANQISKDGGNQWTWTVFENGDALGRSYSGTEKHTMQDINVAVMASVTPTFRTEPVFIAHVDQVKAGGTGAAFDLMEQKMRHARKRLEEKHARMLLASAKAVSTDPDSLYEAIPVDPTTSGAFNGLNGAAGSQTYWRNQTQTSSGSWASDGINKLDALLNSIAEEASDPDILVTTKAVFQFIQQYARGKFSLNAQVTTKAGKQMADAGIPVLNFNGIPIIHDSFAQSGKILALSADAIKWCAVEGGDGTLMGDGFEKATVNGVMGAQAWLRLEGALCCFERRALGQVDTISDA